MLESVDRRPRATANNFRDYLKHLALRPTGPTKRFVIFSRGRSGSTLLVDLLDSVDSVWCDDEILHYRVYFPRLHVEAQAGKVSTDIYGFKLLTYQVDQVQGIANPKAFLQSLVESGYQFIYLVRRNLLRYGLSNMVALQRGKFHFRDSAQRVKYRINVDELFDWMEASQTLADQEAKWLSGISFLELFYEDDLLKAASHQATVDRVCQYLQIPSTPVKTNLRRATPPRIADFVENADELLTVIAKSPFAEYAAQELANEG
ncbi:MAG: hypothetical protein AAGG02_06500 [Cyanobacteria bacterium P01_H01_bin.15]